MGFWNRLIAKPDNRYPQKLMESLLAMAWFVEARDPYTGGHLWRVSRYAWLLAREMGLPSVDVARISLGGFLHDLGKVGIADDILRKPGALTEQEYQQIKTHPDIGLKMLAGHPLASLVSDSVGKHHERPDGLGYPKGLDLTQLSIDARIVGICDAFDAMTSHRPYRPGMPLEKTLGIVQENAGTQFDSELVKVLISLAEKDALLPVLGHSDEGIPLQSCPMCGPTLVIRAEQHAGEFIYCRNCGGEFELATGERGQLQAVATGKNGAPSDLEPEADGALIARTVKAISSQLPLDDLLNL